MMSSCCVLVAAAVQGREELRGRCGGHTDQRGQLTAHLYGSDVSTTLPHNMKYSCSMSECEVVNLSPLHTQHIVTSRMYT